MGMVLIYGIILLILFAVCAPIIYFILKKKGKPRLGKIIASIILITVLLLFFTNEIDQITYSKANAKEDLKLANLNLKDDFEIVDNKVSGMPERLQSTKLLISLNDRNRIINEIKGGKYFKESNDERNLYHAMLGKNSKKIVSNYIVNNEFYREFYEKSEGYVAISITINLNKKSNILELNKMED